MDAVTYPDSRVVTFLNERVVAFKPQIETSAALAERFGVAWTPGLVWLTRDGRTGHDNVGWFAPEEWLAESKLGCGKVEVRQKRWDRAARWFEEVLEQHARSLAAPAACYWAGVAAKRSSGSSEALLERWRRLLEEWPDSGWAKKVEFIRGS